MKHMAECKGQNVVGRKEMRKVMSIVQMESIRRSKYMKPAGDHLLK